MEQVESRWGAVCRVSSDQTNSPGRAAGADAAQKNRRIKRGEAARVRCVTVRSEARSRGQASAT